jgi:uncharacterized NAD(P)/FAD-binding protein YdhS
VRTEFWTSPFTLYCRDIRKKNQEWQKNMQKVERTNIEIKENVEG